MSALPPKADIIASSPDIVDWRKKLGRHRTDAPDI
jgi:hypothetical protein